MINKIGYFVFVAAALAQTSAFAEELDEDSPPKHELSIEDLAKTGKGFDAIVRAATIERELTTAEKFALGNSAWSLGLAERAKTYWDDALADKSIRDGERYRVMFMRAVLSLQEGQYSEAMTLSDQAIGKLSQSPLRAHFRAVYGEAKKLSGDLIGAEKSYLLAADEAKGPFKSEAKYQLADVQLRLGKMALARQTFTDIDPGSQFAVNAIKRLIQLDNTAENYEAVVNWVQRGLAMAPEEFKDGWTTYYRVTALSRLGKSNEAIAALNEFKARNSDQDLWYSLSEANLVRASLDPVVKEAEEAHGR
jgi:tetratricopeptide (TPR) repeat protein